MKTEKNKLLSNDITLDLPVAIYTCNKEGFITSYNNAAVIMWGRTPVLGKEKCCGSFKLFNTDGTLLPADECPMAIALKEGRTVSDQEIELERPDGSILYGKPFATPLFDSKGIISGAVNMVEDITERRKHDEYNHHLAAIVRYSEDAIISKAIDGTIKTWNKGAEHIFGYTAKQMVGKNISKIIPTEYLKEEKEFLKRITNNETILNYETVRVKKSGEQIHVSVTLSPLKDKDGKFVGVSKIARDITKEKLASQYTRSLIEASKDPMITINKEGKIMDMNQAMIEVTDKSRKMLTGSDFFNYFKEKESARKIYKEIFEKGFVTNYPLTLIDGKLTPVLCNGSTYKDEQGKVLGAVVVARVITEQKRFEKELTEARVFAELATEIAEAAKIKAENATKIAEEAVKSKQQFLSNMSHEIRTPMNAIIGFTKVVLKTELTVKQKEYLTAIKVSGDSLIVLINDILDLAKVDAGKMTFAQTPFKLSLSISAMLHLFETKIQEKNLELVKQYDNTIPEVLLGDPVRLHQIILNLVSNAVKFTNQGKITVSVRMLEEDNEKVIIEFAVSDTGIGISKDKLKTVFENFQRATSDTARLYGGTGLGLAIVKQLVEPQGGTINVQSETDKGTTFSFTLPFQKTTEIAEVLPEIITQNKEIKNIKVLVVEDIALNQLLMKTLLDDFGFERDIAANGKIAIEKMEANTYDVILMDLQMPEMNGFEATDYIRTTMNSSIPIIALTADVTTVDLEKCKAVGMNDYLAKPVDEKLLYSKIVNLVKKQTAAVTTAAVVSQEKLDIEIKKQKYIDMAYLNHRTKSNPQLMAEMISLYLEQTPPLIALIKESFTNNDWGSLKAAVHKIIPSFSIMGISTEYENLAKKIHEYATVRQKADDMNDLVTQLENVCLQACNELKEEMNNLKNTYK